MWRGFFASCRYSVICWSERWRPNHVFHQKRNGMSTISQPVVKNRIFCVRDMECLRLDCGAMAPSDGLSESVDEETALGWADIKSRVGLYQKRLLDIGV